MEKIKTTYNNDNEILQAIDQLYLNNKGIELDCTYSQGNFYKKFGFKEPKLKSDKMPLYDDVIKADFKDLHFIDRNSLTSVLIDPPFLFRERKSINNDKISKRFSCYNSYTELMIDYETALKEFSIKLKMKGIVIFKCQDMSDGKFYCLHNEVLNFAKQLNFRLMDIFILIKENKIFKGKTQNLAKKTHSYYLVFKKV